MLVIGGGDGGVVREVLKHKSVTNVVLCEIDQVKLPLAFWIHILTKKWQKCTQTHTHRHLSLIHI